MPTLLETYLLGFQ